MHHNKRRHKQCRQIFFGKKGFLIFFPPILGVIGLQRQDELEQTLPSRPACRGMVLDLVRWTQGAQNAEK